MKIYQKNTDLIIKNQKEHINAFKENLKNTEAKLISHIEKAITNNNAIMKQDIEHKLNETIMQVNKEQKVQVQALDPRTMKYEVLKNDFNLVMRENTSDISVFYQIFVDENYWIDNENFMPNTILDIGANVGYSAIYFVCKYPNAKIYALEPDIDNFEVLKKNTEKYPNIKILNGALFDKNVDLNIVDAGNGYWGLQVSPDICNTNKKTVGYTIEDLLKYWNLEDETLDIVKIDIEGSEKEVFERDCDWLSRTKILFIETHDRFKKGSSRPVLEKLLQHDFNLDVRGDNLIFTNNNLVAQKDLVKL